MADIHEIIAQHGVEAARSMAETKAERRLVDIAAEVMAADADGIGITHSGFCLTALPHRQIPDPVWRRDGHRVTLLVRSGLDRAQQQIGVPYGSRARIILIYLQTMALRAKSPTVELGGSMNDWLSRMNLPVGGATYTQIREQARRISSCELTFFYNLDSTDQEGAGRRQGHFVRDEIVIRRRDASQGHLWREEVTLDEMFFAELVRHPVPLSEVALRQISGKSLALDIYLWLAYRLHSLEKRTAVSWPALFGQFGGGFAHLKHFKPDFTRNLLLATAVYPQARVEMTDTGIVMHPSAPPVAKPKLALTGR